MGPSVGVAFITHRAKHHLAHSLPPILSSSLKPRVLVVNSSSGDGTVELAEKMGAETLVIPRSEFNHGTTREKARKHLNTDVVIMMTPDAYAVHSNLIEELVQPLLSCRASISYAKQIPHEGADFFEAFPRHFNYPAKSHIRSLENRTQYGVYTFFCSNSCAAYLNSALDEVGGFPSVLFGEDTYVVAKMLQAGHKIAYVAEAIVRHSHRYSLKQEFHRHFDIGMVRRECRHLLSAVGKDSKRGQQFMQRMIKELSKEKPSLVPYAFLQALVKWFGYQLGRASLNSPTWWKKRCSSQDFYWVSKEHLKN
jgi:rhamnosyltransferase